MTLVLIVPAPVSTNALYANVPGKGRRKTRAYRSWIDAAGWEAKVQLMGQRELIPPLHSRVEMVVELPPGLDVDNIKALGDLMQRLGVVANDRDIEHLDVWRRERADVQIKIRGVRSLGQAARAPAGDGWRPIATYLADEDGWGPNVLLFVPTGQVAPASDYRILTGRLEAGMWLDWDDTGAMGDIAGKPTHWRPLPAPPEDGNAG